MNRCDVTCQSFSCLNHEANPTCELYTFWIPMHLRFEEGNLNMGFMEPMFKTDPTHTRRHLLTVTHFNINPIAGDWRNIQYIIIRDIRNVIKWADDCIYAHFYMNMQLSLNITTLNAELRKWAHPYHHQWILIKMFWSNTTITGIHLNFLDCLMRLSDILE